MASFSVRFLGCKVSFADAQAIRERLLADGHTEVEGGGDVAVVNTCCVTHEAVSKSRQAVSRAARTHRRVYVTGCGANLEGAFGGMPDHVSVVARSIEETPATVAGEVGAIAGQHAAGAPPRFWVRSDGASRRGIARSCLLASTSAASATGRPGTRCPV